LLPYSYATPLRYFAAIAIIDELLAIDDGADEDG